MKKGSSAYWFYDIAALLLAVGFFLTHVWSFLILAVMAMAFGLSAASKVPKSAEDAEAQVTVWEWSKNVQGAEDITVSAIKKYNTYCAGIGVDKNVFVKAWKSYNDTKADVDANGDSVAYSKTVKVMPQINALPISAAQKTAIALCFWSQSTVNKYKLW